MIEEVTSKNFESIKDDNKYAIIDFWAPSCGPCKALSQIITEISDEYERKITLGKCNVEDEEDLPLEYGIRNIPTVLFFKNGNMVDKSVGMTTKEKLKNKIDLLLS